MGTLLQEKGLQPGELPELWNITHSDIITDIHKAYYASGCNIVTTNTFGANRLKFDNLEEIISAAINNAKKARDQFSGDRYIAYDIGSLGKMLKPLGDLEFIADTLENQDIRTYYERKWYPECLYLLAMLDYISRENDVPLCNEYDDLRQCKLEKPVYPAGIRAVSVAANNDDALIEAERTAIPEFKRFNIIENEVRNVI